MGIGTSCPPCIPSNYRGTWVCEVCGNLCEAPPVPSSSFRTTPLPSGGVVVLREEPQRLDPRCFGVVDAPMTTLRLTNVPGETAEVAAIAWLIARPPGYAVDFFAGWLHICRLENGQYAVTYQDKDEELFDQPGAAARRFVELRHGHQIGYDFEVDPTRKKG